MPPTMQLDSSASSHAAAPNHLIQSLQDVRRRVKVFAVAYGAGVVIAAAAGLLLATVLLDWMLNLPRPLRVVFVLAALGAFFYALYNWVFRPLMARLTINDVAGRLEHTFPQFDDRLRSTVDFVREGGHYIPGSDPMKQKVVAEASSLAQNVDLNRVIVARPVWYSVAGGVGALAVLVLLAVLAGGDFLRIAGNRLVGGAARYPKSVQIALLGNLPNRVPVGRPVDVKMKLAKGSTKKAVVEYRYDNGPWQKELMTLGADGTFAAALDSRLRPDQNTGTLEIKVQAGDDEVELPKVTMVPRLDVARIEAHVTPPPYAGPTVTAVNLGERPATMAVGSKVDLRIEFNKALATGQPVLIVPSKADQKSPQISWTTASSAVAVGQFQAGESIRFTVRATDIDGFENTGTQEYDLLVREDGMPTVQIEEPRRSEDRTPEAAFPVRVVAEDDYGISSAQLVVKRLTLNSSGDGAAAGAAGAPAAGPNSWVIDLVKGETVAANASWALADERAERKRFRLEYVWDLSASLQNANLKPGDVLEYFVQVRDNFDLNGRQHDYVASGKLRLNIISQEQLVKQIQSAFEQLHGELGQIRRGQTSTKVETEALAQQSKQRGKFEDADQKQAERLSNQQGTTAAQTKQTAGKLQDLLERMSQNKSQDAAMKQTADEVGKQLEQTAEGAMKEASKELSGAKDQKTDPKASDAQKKQQNEQREAALARAQEKQDQAASQLQQAMERLGNFGGLSEAIARIAEIKKNQENLAAQFNKQMKDHLGKKPEDLEKKTQEELKRMAEEQKKLQAQTEQALTDMNKKGDQMQKSDPSSASAMKQAAQTGQQQAVPSKQQQASQAMQQNQQAQAQQAQKQAALGLEMILAKLREAERRKLEALAKQLEEMQKLVQDLVRRQSGHNIDNLTIDNPKKLADMTEADRNELVALAERDAAHLPAPPTVEQLSASQEQTERNTRDVAKSAEQLPQQDQGAAVIASKLVAAAGQMERAIVHLRAQKLSDAYEPPQVEALKALVEAKAAVDEWKAKVDEQLQQQDRETIKQAYVKLLESQKKLNKDTLDIDGTPKDPAGALPRLVAVRLGQLPPEQGKLSETAEGLGKELEKIGSVVYVWANQDIVRSMNDVKDDLAKPDTGKVTQAEQTRIAEQLQSMIDNLVEKPKQSKFAQRGGGQCKGGVKMPTETELRLLKGLQVAVNKSTKTVDAEPKKDDAQKRVLVDLGGRQGELRGLLDQLMQKASEGKVKLGPEPDNKDQLPEEAKAEALEDQELQDFLIKEEVKDGEGQDTIEKSVKLTGDRMARSRQRLALNNDPGAVTQNIQGKIIETLDQLIELSRQQTMQSQNPQQAKNQGQKQGQKQIGTAKLAQQNANQQGKKPGVQQTGGQNPAAQSTRNQGEVKDADLSQELQEKAAEWGVLTARQREAIIESKGDQVIEKYRGLVEDYYRELSKKAKPE